MGGGPRPLPSAEERCGKWGHLGAVPDVAPCPSREAAAQGRPEGPVGPRRRPVASPPLPWGRGARPILAVASHFVMLQFLKNTCPTYRNKNAGVCLAPFTGLEIVFL